MRVRARPISGDEFACNATCTGGTTPPRRIGGGAHERSRRFVHRRPSLSPPVPGGSLPAVRGPAAHGAVSAPLVPARAEPPSTRSLRRSRTRSSARAASWRSPMPTRAASSLVSPAGPIWRTSGAASKRKRRSAGCRIVLPRSPTEPPGIAPGVPSLRLLFGRLSGPGDAPGPFHATVGPEPWRFQASSEQSMDSRLRGNDGKNACHVIPAKPVLAKAGSGNPRFWATGVSLCALRSSVNSAFVIRRRWINDLGRCPGGGGRGFMPPMAPSRPHRCPRRRRFPSRRTPPRRPSDRADDAREQRGDCCQ